MDLSSAEIRVLGCLLEKQRTTPDHYPLSLNSLRLACNQSTNRDPVVQYDEALIRDALHRLERRGYVRLAGAGRAAKYRHLLAEALPMSDAEQAAICVLMLRGPQTPGELKQRGERIHAFADLAEVHATLEALIERELVARLARRPGQKEERYAQLLSEEESANGSLQSATQAPGVAQQPADVQRSTGVVQQPTGQPAVMEAPPAHPRLAAPAPAGNGDSDQDEGRLVRDLRERVERLEREVSELREVIRS
jgi:uncharacterized protein